MTTSNTPIYASQARPWLKFYDQKYIDQTMPACTAFELVCRQNKNRLGETALEYYGRKFTYADFIVNVKKTAAALRAAGLKKGDIATVVSVMPDFCMARAMFWKPVSAGCPSERKMTCFCGVWAPCSTR